MSRTIEERLQKLEWELEALKTKSVQKDGQSDWLSTMIGSFENDPDFDRCSRSRGRNYNRSAATEVHRY